ncbi:MAG: hypothetical protein CVU39_00885 [Chloroflexi bacterium HGW-Chloroflexi-10]|nr:MAG: hypothetical protein CVU39_00885 [Chloroflexi bacterium HGW-Chloroflexi-10]
MPSRTISDITVVYDVGELATAELLSDTVAKVLPLIQESWGLGGPKDCRIYVMTSWWGFFFQSAPWFWRILLILAWPLWCFRARRAWPYSAGWTQRYGRQVAIGIKPPRLLEVSDKRIGRHLFVEEKNSETKIRHLMCHELTHACAASLKLPAWLNEGLAAVTVDRYLGKRTIRPDTVELLRSYRPKHRPPTYRELLRLEEQVFAYHAVRGYWLVQYLEESQAGCLKRLLSSWQGDGAGEAEIARVLGMELGNFWDQIDDRMVAYFEMKGVISSVA